MRARTMAKDGDKDDGRKGGLEGGRGGAGLCARESMSVYPTSIQAS